MRIAHRNSGEPSSTEKISMASNGESLYQTLVERCRSLEARQAKLRKEFNELVKDNSDSNRQVVADHNVAAAADSSVGSCVPGFFAAGSPYRSVLESMGHAVHVCSASSGVIIYWNRSAEHLYGWKDYEVIGQNVSELIIAEEYYTPLNKIMDMLRSGKSWSGQFPFKKRSGEVFMAMVTKSPLYEDGVLAGVITVSSDAATFNSINSDQDRGRVRRYNSRRIQWHPPRPQMAPVPNIASSVSNLASKLLSRRQGDDICASSGDREDTAIDAQDTKFEKPGTLAARVLAKLNVIGNGSSVREDNGVGAQKNGANDTSLTSEVENEYHCHSLAGPKATPLRKGERAFAGFSKECHECFESQRPGKSMPRFDSQVDANLVEPEVQHSEVLETEEEGQRESDGKRFSSFGESGGSRGSTSSKWDNESSSTVDCEIQWKDLQLGEEVGQGSCAVVYRGIWKGTDVAVKVYLGKAYSEDTLEDYKKEINIMKNLRHPNVLLFMGAVYSEERLAIVTEFLPRGSLFKTLHRNNQRLDIRRRMRMALDVARGMNYLHHRNPPIVHRDLKSSNLLVDRNLTVKVGDFGLSRWKNGTYITAKSGRGTPQWMAPEVLRSEPSNEKSDVYSFGVILWELITVSIPWNNLNSLQVVGVVGFMDRRLDIPEGLDPQIASIIRDCWKSVPEQRPSFEDIIQRMGGLVHRKTSASV